MTWTRRQLMKTVGQSGLVALAASGRAFGQVAPADGRFTLAPLPYASGALQPHLDARTMQIHHDCHHRAYVDGLNAAVARAGAAGRLPLDELLRNLRLVPETVRDEVRQCGGGHANHQQFWTVMAPGGGGPATGAIKDAIDSTFGDFDTFTRMFEAVALGRFGSGWAWLSEDQGRLVIHSTAGQDTPSMEHKRAIFGLDVWEHAYYLQYQHRRSDYVSAFWHVIDWTEVNRRLRS